MTLHRQHADRKEQFRQASEAYLLRQSTGASDAELAEATAWMQKDSKALVDWEAEHADFLNRNRT